MKLIPLLGVPLLGVPLLGVGNVLRPAVRQLLMKQLMKLMLLLGVGNMQFLNVQPSRLQLTMLRTLRYLQYQMAAREPLLKEAQGMQLK
jgi:hypothetical protein